MATTHLVPTPTHGTRRRRLISLGASAVALLVGACAEAPNLSVSEPAVDATARSSRPSSPLGSSPASLIRLADATRAAGDVASAAGLYGRAAQAAPDDVALQVRIGFVLHELEAHTEAEAAFRRALAADMGNPDALRGLGITLIARDMPRHAIEYLERAIAARPDSRAYNAIGVALDMAGERESAEAAYRAGLAGDPHNLTLLNNLGLSLALSGRHAEAIAVLREVASRPDANARHRQNLALAYGLAGRSDKAAEVAHTDLSMRAVRNNIGVYAWLREQPADAAGGALSANVRLLPPPHDSQVASIPEPAPPPPKPPLAAAGVEPPYPGGAGRPPVVLTPRYDAGTRLHVIESTPDPAETGAETPPPLVWELQSVVTERPAGRDAGVKTDGGRAPLPEGGGAPVDGIESANSVRPVQAVAIDPVVEFAGVPTADPAAPRSVDPLASAGPYDPAGDEADAIPYDPPIAAARVETPVTETGPEPAAPTSQVATLVETADRDDLGIDDDGAGAAHRGAADIEWEPAIRGTEPPAEAANSIPPSAATGGATKTAATAGRVGTAGDHGEARDPAGSGEAPGSPLQSSGSSSVRPEAAPRSEVAAVDSGPGAQRQPEPAPQSGSPLSPQSQSTTAAPAPTGAAGPRPRPRPLRSGLSGRRDAPEMALRDLTPEEGPMGPPPTAPGDAPTEIAGLAPPFAGSPPSIGDLARVGPSAAKGPAPPPYGLVVLALAGLLALLWVRRRGMPAARRGARSGGNRRDSPG